MAAKCRTLFFWHLGKLGETRRASGGLAPGLRHLDLTTPPLPVGDGSDFEVEGL
jgi:hypothetical protein